MGFVSFFLAKSIEIFTVSNVRSFCPDPTQTKSMSKYKVFISFTDLNSNKNVNNK